MIRIFRTEQDPVSQVIDVAQHERRINDFEMLCASLNFMCMTQHMAVEGGIISISTVGKVVGGQVSPVMESVFSSEAKRRNLVS